MTADQTRPPDTAPPPRRVAAVVNPTSRRSLERIHRALEAACPPGVALSILVSGHGSEVTDLARAACSSADLVAAVGGDGTAARVATALAGTGVPLGLVPAGSTNIVAREVGIPIRLEAAARLLFAPHRLVRRDLGRWGDRRFLHMAGVGLDARLFARTDPRLKRRFGWVGYVPAALAAARDPAARISLAVDDARLDLTSPLVLVANGRSIIHPSLQLDRGIAADDGWFDVLVFPPLLPAALLQAVAGIAMRDSAARAGVVSIRGRTVAVDAQPPLQLQLDGDVVGLTPATLVIEPGAILLAAPPTDRWLQPIGSGSA